MADVKPDTKPSITISCQGDDGERVRFKMKLTATLVKMKEAYCKKKGLTGANVRFLYNGDAISTEKTPAYYDMEDGDVLDVMVTQQGGSTNGHWAA